jgi:4-nitrophenyl phosphatase
MTKENINFENFEKLIENNDTFLFDCDGVIWRGNEPIKGSIEFLQFLRKKVIFNKFL